MSCATSTNLRAIAKLIDCDAKFERAPGALRIAAAEIDRLRAGIKEIDRFLTENRIGDALFVCDALLTGGDEQLEGQK